MRLLKCDQQGRLSLTKDITKDVPPYAILSHTWSPNDEDEVTFEDITTGADTTKIGYDKLRFCVQQAAKDGLAYSWVDTCCINKASEPELSQAIRSMFRWYRDAKRCYVYLYDVQRSTGDVGWETEFTGSHWFSRGPWLDLARTSCASKSGFLFPSLGQTWRQKYSPRTRL